MNVITHRIHSTNSNHASQIVTPKRGRALIWPSVLNEDPHKKDDRTEHEAMPVLKGEKFGTLS